MVRARWVSRWAGPRKDPRGVEVGALGVWGRSVVKGTLWCPAQTLTALPSSASPPPRTLRWPLGAGAAAPRM